MGQLCLIIFNLLRQPVQRFAQRLPGFLVIGDRHTCYFPELCRQMLRAAVTQPESNITQGHLSVADQLFNTLNAQQNQIAFNGDVLPFGKNFA